MERNGERGEGNERAGRGMIRQYPSRYRSAGARIYNGAAARTGRSGDDGADRQTRRQDWIVLPGRFRKQSTD